MVLFKPILVSAHHHFVRAIQPIQARNSTSKGVEWLVIDPLPYPFIRGGRLVMILDTYSLVN